MSGSINTQDARSTRQYFDRVAPGWSARYRASRHFRMRLQTILDWARKLPRQRAPKRPLSVLDYGCGSGVIMEALLNALPEASVTGVDASPAMIEAAHATLGRYDEMDRTMLEVIEPPDFSGLYQTRQYDLICCLGVIEYLDDPWATLSRLTELLSDNGVLMLSFPNADSSLRYLEQWVFSNRRWLSPLGVFPQLTGEQSYLKHQRRRFTLAEVDSHFMPLHMARATHRHQVAPGPLASLAHEPWLGMTTLAAYRKSIGREASAE